MEVFKNKENNEYLSEFLNYINEFYNYNKMTNPNFEITRNQIYRKLTRFKIESESNEPYFNRWIDRFKTRPGIDVFREKVNSYFCRFNNGKVDYFNAIKIYIPFKSNEMDANVTKLFDFIRSNNINHESKVAKDMRNDVVVIRVNNKEDASKIIDYVDKNFKKYLGKPSPLVGNYKGVGITKDGNHSYHDELCKVIEHMLNNGIKLDANTYTNYLNQIANNTKDQELKTIYKIGTMCNKKINLDIIDSVNNKPVKNPKILYEIMDETYKKYGDVQVQVALYKYITANETKYFTRGESKLKNLRKRLEFTLTNNDVLEIITKGMNKNNNLSDLITMFVNQRYADKISNKKENEIKKENAYYELLKTIYISEGYNSLVQKINKDYDNNKEMIDRIILMAYPQVNTKMINEYYKNKQIGYIIANLVKGYVDIQENANYKR